METTLVLSIIDWTLTAMAVVVLVYVWWQDKYQKMRTTTKRASISPSPQTNADLQANTPDQQKPLLGFTRSPSNTLQEDAILWGVVGYVAGAAILTIVGLQLWGKDGGVPASILIGSGSQILGAMVCVWLASSRFTGGSRGFLFGPGNTAARVPGRVTLLAVVCAWGLCPVVLEVTVLTIKLIAPDFVLPEHPTIDALAAGNQTSIVVVLLWIGAALVAPVTEEIFFRGFIQTLLNNMLHNRSLAIIGASIIFAGIHFSQQPHAVPALIVLACILGYIYERTGSLVPAMLVHGLFNLKTLVWHHIESMST